MIGLKKFDLAFTGKLAHHWIVNKSFINHIQAGLGANAFNMDFGVEQKYVRLKPFIELNIKNNHPNNGISQKIILESNIIRTGAKSDFSIENFSKKSTAKYFVGTYEYEDNNKITPQKFITQVQNKNNDFKLTASFETGIMYKRNKYFKARGFAGIVSNAKSAFGFKLQTSAFDGNDDYLYNNMYLGRNESNGLLSKQIYIQEGGFRQLTWHQNYIGYSNLILGSLNFTFDLPIKLPISLYADLGIYGLKQPYNYVYDKIQYDGGLIFKLSNNFQINLPLFASLDFKENYKSVYNNQSKFKQYTNRITFIFNINAMNPVSIAQNFKIN
jgi:hypothetical protein